MIRHLVTFLVTFAVGAVVALATRTALHEPHPDVTTTVSAEHEPMVHNPLTPPASPTSNDHVDHETHAATSSPAKDKPPVNQVCAICGMDVDPKLPTSEYQGKTIGFGCKMCRPKFEADPDKYGPAYLRGEVIKR